MMGWRIVIGLAHLWLCLTSEQLSQCHGVGIVKHIQEILGQLDGKKYLQTCHLIRSISGMLGGATELNRIGCIVKDIQEILSQLDTKNDLQTRHPIRSSWSGLTLSN